LLDRHAHAARRSGRVAHAREASLKSRSRVDKSVGDEQAVRHEQALLHAPRRRAQVDVAVDHAGHDRQMAGIHDVGITRHAARAIDADDGVVLEYERGAADRIGTGAVDEGATANSRRHGVNISVHGTRARKKTSKQ